VRLTRSCDTGLYERRDEREVKESAGEVDGGEVDVRRAGDCDDDGGGAVAHGEQLFDHLEEDAHRGCDTRFFDPDADGNSSPAGKTWK
jgi:hypothetical protein